MHLYLQKQLNVIYFTKLGEVIMKLTKNQFIVAICSVAILLISLTVLLLDVFVPLNFWTHPVLNFLFMLSIGYGVMCLVIGIVKRSSANLFLSAILLGLALLYAFTNLIGKFWVAIIIDIVVFAIIFIAIFMLGANKTESIALNEAEDYKNYKERQKEKAEEEKNKEEEKLPEIKSFK